METPSSRQFQSNPTAYDREAGTTLSRAIVLKAAGRILINEISNSMISSWN
jgi:hypothetical protein